MAINKAIIEKLDTDCQKSNAQWIAVTKMQSVDTLRALYQTGKKVFGENKAQELWDKYTALPDDIEWHFIGHLQTNKVKSIIDKVQYIHSVDSIKLLDEIQKQAKKIDKKISVFIQLHVAKEETKYGFSPQEAIDFFKSYTPESYSHIHIVGLMAMASFISDKAQVKSEFLQVQSTKNTINQTAPISIQELSMGMSSDYEIALACGATYLRIGSILFQG